MSRVFQLTMLFVLFLVTGGSAHFTIERALGDRFSFGLDARFTGPIAEELLVLELMLLPLISGAVCCIVAIRIFRLRHVSNEIADTLQPILQVVTGYGRFLLVAISVIYFAADHTTTGLVHLALGAVAFAWFYLAARVQECPVPVPMSQEDRHD